MVYREHYMQMRSRTCSTARKPYTQLIIRSGITCISNPVLVLVRLILIRHIDTVVTAIRYRISVTVRPHGRHALGILAQVYRTGVLIVHTGLAVRPFISQTSTVAVAGIGIVAIHVDAATARGALWLVTNLVTLGGLTLEELTLDLRIVCLAGGAVRNVLVGTISLAVTHILQITLVI